MIITNFTAKFIVTLAAKITPNTVGVTIWPFIFIWPAIYVGNERLIKHERKHLEQWLRYWWIGFIFIYLYQYLKFGYKNMPLEVEARIAEVESAN